MIDQVPGATHSFAEVIAELRDGVFILGLPIFGWKARSWFQPVKDFFARANNHMSVMELGMQKLLDNHLSHIQADLDILARSKESHAIHESGTAGIFARPPRDTWDEETS